MSNKRANKGGETGMNGEFYAGGTFLPSTTLPKQAPSAKKTTTRKQQIAPFVWEVAPADGLRAIYPSASVYATNERGKPLTPYMLAFEKLSAEHQSHLLNLMERYNNGERWM